MDLPQFVEQTEPETVFTLLSDRKRVDILRALWEDEDGMTFSELYDAVDVDDSGQFNYHLDKLVGQFVTKDGGTYELTVAGRQINGAIEAGSYTTSGAMNPIELESPCPSCDGTREFHYKDEKARLVCDSCEFRSEFAVPPSAFVDCSRDEIPMVAGEYLRSILHGLEDGFCPQCDGPVDREVLPVTESSAWNRDEIASDDRNPDVDDAPILQYRCRRCGLEPTVGLTLSLLTHPVVVGFYHDHGIDVRNQSLWDVTAFGPDHERIRSRNPLRVAVRYTLASDELVVVVDENLDVVDVEYPV